MVNLTQSELAARAKMARQTVVDFERGTRAAHPNNVAAIRAALEAAGIEFIPADGGGPGVRLKENGSGG